MVSRFFNTKEEDNFDDLVGEEQKSNRILPNDKHSSKNESVQSNVKLSAEMNGWLPIDQAPRNGMPCFISNVADGYGVLAYWKKTRAFANITHRWEEFGKYVDHLTGNDIPFKPVFYRPRF